MINGNNDALKAMEAILNNIDTNIYATVPETGELLFVNKKLRSLFGIEDKDLAGQYCYKIFRQSEEKCAFCPTFRLEKEPDATIVWEEYIPELGAHVRHSDCIIEWPNGEKVHLQHAIDITDIIHTQKHTETRGKLLEAVNRTAALLLTSDANEKIESLLDKSLEILGRTIETDRVHLWRKKTADGETCYTAVSEWISESEQQKPAVPGNVMTQFSKTEMWADMIGRQNYAGGMVSDMPEAERDFFDGYGVQSIFLLPLYLSGKLWGVFSIADRTKERSFSEDEITILRSISLMMASAINRQGMIKRLRESGERTMLMLDTSPVCTQIWARDLSTIDCNEACVRLYKFKDKKEYVRRFLAECSPECQPCGQRSDEKAVAFVNKAFEEGICVFEWMHRIPDDNIVFPAEITLVRAEYKNQDVVLGYTRDLREQYKAMEERDDSLKAMSGILNGIDALIYTTVPETGEILFVNDHMKKQYNLEGDIVGEKCYKVFQQGMEEKCDFCPCNKLDADPDSIIVWEEYSPLTNRIYRNTDRYMQWYDGSTVHVQHGIDITDIVQTQKTLKSRDALLQSVNRAAALLQNSDLGVFEDVLKQSMGLIAEAAQVDAVYLWKNETIDGKLHCFQLFEWSLEQTVFADGTPYSYDDIVPGWKETLSGGNYINNIVRNMSQHDQDHLSPSGILSVLVVPIFIEDRFWGFVGFDDCRKERLFAEEEQSVLHSASLIIANSFIRNKMITDIRDTSERLTRQDKLLQAVNKTAFLLLTASDEDDIEIPLQQSLEFVGQALGADRVHVWRNETVNGELRFMHIYEWLSEVGGQKASVPMSYMTPYAGMGDWIEKFSRNETVGGPLSSLSPNDREYFKAFDVKTILLIPLFIDEEFWGLVSIDDCKEERIRTEDEVSILRSVSLMIASAINRRVLAEQVIEAGERSMLMLDTSPLCAQIWARDLSTIDCNAAAVNLYKFKDKAEYTARFIGECSPEYQPCGMRSDEKAVALVNQAFEEGYCHFEWTHRIPDDDILFPAGVTLVRAEYKNQVVVIGYTRDLREHHKMMAGIRHRDNMLQAVNQASVMLLTSREGEDIEATLRASMELIGTAMDADRIYIWQGDFAKDEYRYTCIHSWDSELGKSKNHLPIGANYSPALNGLDWDSAFFQDKCVSGSYSTMSPAEQAVLDFFEIRSIAIVPMFLDDQLWGIFCVGDCKRERVLTDEEDAILRSVSLMMASTINRYELIERRTRDLALQSATLTTLLDAIPDMIFTKDADLMFTHCNAAFLKYFNKNREDVIGHDDETALKMPPEINESHKKQNHEIMRLGEIVTIEEYLPRYDGKGLLFETTRVPLSVEGETIGIVGIARDITERRHLENERATDLAHVRKQGEALARITMSPAISSGDLKAAADLIVREGGTVLNSDRISIWSLTDDESTLECLSCYVTLSGEYGIMDDYDLTSRPKYANRLMTERLLVINNREECDIILSTDTEGDYQSLCAALEAPIRVDGKLAGVVSVEQNYNDEYLLGRRWRTGERGFASSLADLMALAISGFERRQARDEAHAASQAKTDFLANMSHEIRTPMNVIVGLTELLIEGDVPAEEEKEYLQKINTAGSTLTGLINDVLDISKIEAGKFDLAPTNYELASLLNDIVTLSIVRIDEKPIEFKLDITGGLFASLYGDDIRVKQVFINILSNAFKYTREGTVTLSVSCEREENDDVRLSFSVRDTGIGMRPDDLENLFSDYNQVDTQANRLIEGTGLGLSIVKGLTELMDGDITVESEYGRGSVFRVSLRQGFVSDQVISEEMIESLRNFRYEYSRRHSDKQIVRPDLSWAKVLVVDDAPTNLDVARGVLGKYKMKVDCVTSGQASIDRIELGQPVYDAVFMDHMMPGMDGIEAASRIRRLGNDYAVNIPIIALTANAVAGNEQLFLDKGFQAFVSKPINIAKLDAVVREWIMKDTESQPAAGPVAATEPGSGDGVTVDIPGVNTKLGLSLYEGDTEMFIDILRSYVENTPAEIDKLRDVTEETIDLYAIDIHTMKGVSASIGAKELSVRAKKMERMAKDGDFASIAELNEDFIRDAEQLVADIEGWLSNNT